MTIIDYDNIENWGVIIGEAIAGLKEVCLTADLARSQPELIDDARESVYRRLGRDRVIDAIATTLQGAGVRLYHGTRLTDAEIGMVRQQGLKPLRLADRAERIADIIRQHPNWSQVADRFPDAIDYYGRRNGGGVREDQRVHACFSRSGLLRGCTHYLTEGAEVDGLVAHRLFGDASADELFRRERNPYLVSFVVPFDVAAVGTNRYAGLERAREIIIDQLVASWAYQQAHPDFQVTKLRDCWAAAIPGVIEPDRLSIEPVDGSDLHGR
jgi:hypothetical protein